MPEFPSKSTPDATLAGADEATETPAVGEAGAPVSGWVVASHEVLFGETQASRCDACGEGIGEGDGTDEGYGFPGRGVYLWRRGDEAHLESAPLCAACASAIGMTALARWEIEEEEG